MREETLAANIIVRDRELLLLERPGKGYWELPGGKVEDGETPREAAVREANEEIGCTVAVRDEWAPFRVTFDHEGIRFTTRGFLVDVVDGTPTPEEDRFARGIWAGPDDLERLDLAPNLEMVQDELVRLLQET